MSKQAYGPCMIGIGIVIVHLLTLLTTMLKSPGIPSAKITEQDIDDFIEKKRYYCEFCQSKCRC